MTTTEVAIKELERAGLFSKDSDYEGLIGEAVKELLLVFQKQGHSGWSANLTSNIFRRLVNGDILSPLTSDESEWMPITETLKQSNRCSTVFIDTDIDKRPYTIDGKAFSDDGGKSFFTSIDSRVYFDLPGYPPETERVILTREEVGK